MYLQRDLDALNGETVGENNEKMLISLVLFRSFRRLSKEIH